MASRFRIGIVGGGFSGAVVALQLCRHLRGPADIAVIEPRPLLGGGVAYSATDPAHRINVPAARMTVLSEDPTQFDRWARAQGLLRQDPLALWSHDLAYPQRGAFGRYVAGMLDDAARARPDVALRHHRALAAEVVKTPSGYLLRLPPHAALSVDVVVLAVSHPPPALPAMLRPLADAGGPIIADPWADGALQAIPPDAEVLVVGTGLTMADVVASLDRRGHRGTIRAFSRRGLLSRGHPPAPAAKRDWFDTAIAPTTARALVAAVRAQVRQAAAEGMPWQAVFDDVRGNGRRLWQALPIPEQRRLVRHIRPFWDVHRFRVAPQAEAAITRLHAAGRFVSRAAALTSARLEGGRVIVELRPRGQRSGAAVQWSADAVVVTTGPAHGSALSANPALASLARQGLLRMDPVGLGLDVDAQSRAVGADGQSRPDLLVAGPLARGRFGELMGLPQVSEHAEAVAIEVARIAERHAGVGPERMAAAAAAAADPFRSLVTAHADALSGVAAD